LLCLCNLLKNKIKWSLVGVSYLKMLWWLVFTIVATINDVDMEYNDVESLYCIIKSPKLIN